MKVTVFALSVATLVLVKIEDYRIQKEELQEKVQLLECKWRVEQRKKKATAEGNSDPSYAGVVATKMHFRPTCCMCPCFCNVTAAARKEINQLAQETRDLETTEL